jgi:hypothetical protein
VPRHIARLVVDYFSSHRLVVDFFAYAARPSASGPNLNRAPERFGRHVVVTVDVVKL